MHELMQFEMDEKSGDAWTIITEHGLFRYAKLPEGVASSLAEWQIILVEILRGVLYTEVYIDNIFCVRKTIEVHREISNKIFNRLNRANLRKIVKKCQLFKNEIEILRFLLNATSIKPTLTKVHSLQKAPVPVNQK